MSPKTLLLGIALVCVVVLLGSASPVRQASASEPSYPNVISCAGVGQAFCCGQPGLNGPVMVCRLAGAVMP